MQGGCSPGETLGGEGKEVACPGVISQKWKSDDPASPGRRRMEGPVSVRGVSSGQGKG